MKQKLKDKDFYKKSVKGYPIAFLCIFLLLLARASDRLLNPVIWAEDGIWLSDILKLGWKSIFLPDAGYFLVLQRAILAFATTFPMAHWPLVITLFCFVTYAALMATFAREEYDRILPNTYQRIMVCCMFAFVPGLGEVLGNVANLGWVFCFYLGFVYLKNVQKDHSKFEVILATLCMLSAGQTIILIPVLVYRILIARHLRSEHSKSLISQDKLLLTIQLGIAFLNFTLRMTNRQFVEMPSHTIQELLEAWFYGFQNGVVLAPLFGFHWTTLMGNRIQWLFWPLCLGISFTWLYFFFRANLENKIRYLFVLSWTGAILLSCVVRTWGYGYFGAHELEETSCYHRLSYVLVPAAIFFWISLWSEIESRFKLKLSYCTSAFAVWYIVINSLAFYRLSSHQQYCHWDERWRELQSSIQWGCPSFVSIAIEPKNWYIQYQSPISNGCVRNMK